MSIVQQQRDLESFADDALVQEGMQPSGRYPQFLVMTEIQRRRDLRDRAKAQQYEGKGTVSDRLMQDMMRGIPSADPAMAEPPPNMPGMAGGIAGFAAGGTIPGYQYGGMMAGPDDDINKMMKRLRMLEASRGRMSRYAPGMIDREIADLESRISSAQQDLSGYGGSAGRTSVPVGGIEMPEASPRLRPHEPYEPLLDATQDLDLMRNSLSALEGIDVAGAYAPALAAVDRMSARAGDREERLRPFIDEIRAMGPEVEESMAALAKIYREGVQEDPSTLERELAGMRRSPEDARREKMALALSGLGSLIGGSSRLGQVAAGMGGVTREILGRDQEMRNEDRDIVTQLAGVEDARRQRNIDLRARALSTEVDSKEAARAIATQAIGLEESIMDARDNIDQITANIQTNIAGARTQSELQRALGSADVRAGMVNVARETRRIRLDLEEQFRTEAVGMAVNPSQIKDVIESTRRAIQTEMEINPQSENIESMREDLDYFMNMFRALSQEHQRRGIGSARYRGEEEGSAPAVMEGVSFRPSGG